MHTAFRAALAALALAFSPLAASAGPMGWNYTASFVGDANPDMMYLGSAARPDNGEADGVLNGQVYGLPKTTNGSGSFPGPAHFRIGGLTNGDVGIRWYSGNAPPPGSLSRGFVADLSVLDAASGKTGAFEVTGTGSLVGDPLSAFTLGLSFEVNTEQERVIGGTRYTVRFDSETTDTGTWLTADVSTASATPEPGTFALAAFGFGALGLRLRWIRRRTVTS